MQIRLDGDIFHAELSLPRHPAGVVFLLRDNGNAVHGKTLTFALREHGFATAVCDLLTRAERERAATTRRLPLCADRLSHRLVGMIDALGREPDLRTLATGITASGTAAAAVLHAAAVRPYAFDAVACRQANLVFAGSLDSIRAATLFLAVAGDLAHIRPMTRVFQQLRCKRRFEILPGLSPAFTEERSFALACDVTAAWMRRHVGRQKESASWASRM